MSKDLAVEPPIRISGIDWRELKKGDTIPVAQVMEAFEFLFPGRPADTEESFKSLAVRDWITSHRDEIGSPLVIRQNKGDLTALKDEEAVAYLNGQASAGLRKHRNQTRRMFTAIDPEALSDRDRRSLETNQSRHGMIAAAVNQTKLKVNRMLKRGDQLPQLLPPDK